MRNLFILYFVIFSSVANASLNICPRMPVAVAVSNQYVTSITAGGATTLAQPAFSGISGTVALASQVSGNLSTSNLNSGTNAGSTTFWRGDGSWAAPTVTNFPTTIQRFTSSSGTYNKDYSFVITSGSATVGATYTNNAVTFTVYATVASATLVVMSGSGAPAASGTLTKASGTGDSTLTFSQVAAPLYLRVKLAGGGGGGGGSSGAGNNNGAAGGDGGTSTFGSSLLTATGGTKGSGTSNPLGGGGGTSTINSPAVAVISQTGQTGGNGGVTAVANVVTPGGSGGNNFLGGGGSVQFANQGAGLPGGTNTGGGGSGAASLQSSASVNDGGGGGGAGAYIEALISSPSATYAYGVGAAGTAGSNGSNGASGGAGGSGIVIVEEYYQ